MQEPEELLTNGSKPRDVLVSHADMPMMGSGDEYDDEE